MTPVTHTRTHTYKDSAAGHRNSGDADAVERGRSSFLICYPPLPGGQHVVERIPADARSVERGQEEARLLLEKTPLHMISL